MLMKNVIDKIKINTEDKLMDTDNTSNVLYTENNFTFHDFKDCFKIVDQKMHLKDKKISILFKKNIQ